MKKYIARKDKWTNEQRTERHALAEQRKRNEKTARKNDSWRKWGEMKLAIANLSREAREKYLTRDQLIEQL